MAMLTTEQLAAVRARGNVLVVAGAGTGKTRTLVQRCISWILDENEAGSLDRVLMVTFTEAAASEMRKRIREALQTCLAKQPEHRRVAEQLALLESAHISTLHSFCYRLIREHFYEINLDPQAGVLTQEQAYLLAQETLDRVFEDSVASSAGGDVSALLQEYGRGRNETVRKLVMQVYNYAQALPDPKAWIERQQNQLASANPDQWLNWFLEAFERFKSQWTPVLAGKDNDNLRQCLAALTSAPAPCTRRDISDCLAQIVEAGANWPRGTKKLFHDPNKAFFQEAAFLQAYAIPESHSPIPVAQPSLSAQGQGDSCVRVSMDDPLQQDWEWSRFHMLSLLGLVESFSRSYSKAKKELGMLDFHDLEQYALQLLTEPGSGGPSAVAREWRERLRLIFVDEYQDINAAQDAILSALGRESRDSNRFLVGDLKQSIYRFRLANPHIFQKYCQEWKHAGETARAIALRENFRSHEGVLSFINHVFPLIMRKEVGGVDYDEEAGLIFGAPGQRRHMAMPVEISPDGDPAVELCLRIKGAGDEDDGGEPDEAGTLAELGDTEWEARMIAGRLKQLQSLQRRVWDDSLASFRPVDFRDMVILLRAPDKKAESYAKEFSRAGVPLQVARGGFYETTEITDLLSLLQVLDNPLQDLPLLAVLRSPVLGLSMEDLAAIRIALRREPFWTALNYFVRNRPAVSSLDDVSYARLHERLAGFIGQWTRWRRMSRRAALSQCLEAILDETHYEDWLAVQSRGSQRLGNVQRLLGLTRQFDQFQRQGLYRFLSFVQAQCDAGVDGESASPGAANAVRLMSIHQSKGLEYPVVVVAGMGKRFNLRELSDPVLLDDYYGLCSHVAPPMSGRRYPSLALWLARKRQMSEIYGEEMRLLYVAMTRARDWLILAGTATKQSLESNFQRRTHDGMEVAEILKGRCCLDWLGGCMARLWPDADWSRSGQNALLRWRLMADSDIAASVRESAGGMPSLSSDTAAGPTGLLSGIAAWNYPFQRAMHEAAKTSVTAFRKRVSDETDGEAKVVFAFEDPPGSDSTARIAEGKELSFADIGIAHHAFLEHVEYGGADEEVQLRAQAQRMIERGALRREEAACLDFAALTRFLNSTLGLRIRNKQGRVHRELPFTTKVPLELLDRFLKPSANPLQARSESAENGSRAQGDAANLSRNSVSALSSAGALSCDNRDAEQAVFEHAGNRLRTQSDGEFVVVQGVIDLAVISDDGIWIVDYKTDRVTARECARKASLYAPQMQLYAAAMEGVYRLPVTECWLYFLNAGVAVACGRMEGASE